MADMQMLTPTTRLLDSVEIINNNFNNIGEVVKAMLGTIYPVGSIYTSTVETNPAELFGVGSWERIGEGRCLIDCGTTYAAGSEGGSADAIIPYHTHEFTGTAVTSGNNSANHTHTFTTGNQSANHTHSGTTGNGTNSYLSKIETSEQTSYSTSNVTIGTTGTSGWLRSGEESGGGKDQVLRFTNSAANHTHTFTTGNQSANHTHSGTTGGISASHTHSVTAAGTNSYAGTSGNVTGANMQPYLAVYMWKRTA